MITIDPKTATVHKVQSLLLGGVSPRPIALVSTISTNGINNLSPFSWFNAFGSNPPTVIISPSRRIRDGSVKDTYNNLIETKECVIHAVTYDMVHQASLSSTEYPAAVDEFVKSGFTPIASEVVTPKRVKESPFHMECKVSHMIQSGDGPGSGNVFICEVVRFHVNERIMKDGIIQPHLSDFVARSSANYYIRAHESAIFEIAKPLDRIGMGFDNLPEYLKKSDILSANNLAQLANCESIPTNDTAVAAMAALPPIPFNEDQFADATATCDYRAMAAMAISIKNSNHFERAIRAALAANNVTFAWHAAVYLGTMN